MASAELHDPVPGAEVGVILRNDDARAAWRWAPYFKPDEFACHHCGELLVDSSFLDSLVLLRRSYGGAMVISSGYRCPAYNAKVSTTGYEGPHTKGAIDVSVRGGDALRLVTLAPACGITGVGVNQKGGGRFIHLDSLPNAEGCPRPFIWSY